MTYMYIIYTNIYSRYLLDISINIFYIYIYIYAYLIKKKSPWLLGCLLPKISAPLSARYMLLAKFSNSFKPQFPLQSGGINGTCLPIWLRELTQSIDNKGLTTTSHRVGSPSV